MPLGSVDTLSDDGDVAPTAKQAEVTPKAKPKAVAKPPKVDKASKPKAKAKQAVLKRPAASSAMKRPAGATKDPDRVTASKGLYKNGTWGLKLNGKQVLLVTWLHFIHDCKQSKMFPSVLN